MWVAITLAGLLLLLTLVLCVPLDATLRLDINGRPNFRFRLGWLFGLVNTEVRREKKKPKRVKAEDKPRPGKSGFKTIIKVLRTKGLIKQFNHLLFRLVRCFKIRDLSADLRVGLGNPADTGLLFAIIGPPFFFLDVAFPHRVKVRPAFTDEAILEGYLNGSVRLLPVKLVIPLLGFTFSLPTLRVIKTLVWRKWKRKG